MKNIQEYLLNGLESGIREYRLVVVKNDDGMPVGYMHPMGKDGVTLDFVVHQDRVTKLGLDE